MPNVQLNPEQIKTEAQRLFSILNAVSLPKEENSGWYGGESEPRILYRPYKNEPETYYLSSIIPDDPQGYDTTGARGYVFRVICEISKTDPSNKLILFYDEIKKSSFHLHVENDTLKKVTYYSKHGLTLGVKIKIESLDENNEYTETSYEHQYRGLSKPKYVGKAYYNRIGQDTATIVTTEEKNSKALGIFFESTKSTGLTEEFNFIATMLRIRGRDFCTFTLKEYNEYCSTNLSTFIFIIIKAFNELKTSYHQQGWVHGDLKRENIMLSKKELKIIDHESLLICGDSNSKTDPNGITPIYASPAKYNERRLIKDHTVSTADDNYSFAILFNEILSYIYSAIQHMSENKSDYYMQIKDIIYKLMDIDCKDLPLVNFDKLFLKKMKENKFDILEKSSKFDNATDYIKELNVLNKFLYFLIQKNFNELLKNHGPNKIDASKLENLRVYFETVLSLPENNQNQGHDQKQYIMNTMEKICRILEAHSKQVEIAQRRIKINEEQNYFEEYQDLKADWLRTKIQHLEKGSLNHKSEELNKILESFIDFNAGKIKHTAIENFQRASPQEDQNSFIFPKKSYLQLVGTFKSENTAPQNREVCQLVS